MHSRRSCTMLAWAKELPQSEAEDQKPATEFGLQKYFTLPPLHQPSKHYKKKISQYFRKRRTRVKIPGFDLFREIQTIGQRQSSAPHSSNWLGFPGHQVCQSPNLPLACSLIQLPQRVPEIPVFTVPTETRKGFGNILRGKLSSHFHFVLNFFNFYLFIYFCFFRAMAVAYGSSQTRGRIRPAAASLHYSHSNARSLTR